MTRDEILAMSAGHELDKLVAENVLGQKPHGSYWPAPYSTEISATWFLVEWLARWQGCSLALIDTGEGWKAHFERPNGRHTGVAHGSQAGHAICLAALLTMRCATPSAVSEP